MGSDGSESEILQVRLSRNAAHGADDEPRATLYEWVFFGPAVYSDAEIHYLRDDGGPQWDGVCQPKLDTCRLPNNSRGLKKTESEIPNDPLWEMGGSDDFSALGMWI
jgi:hypothetical protein